VPHNAIEGLRQDVETTAFESENAVAENTVKTVETETTPGDVKLSYAFACLVPLVWGMSGVLVRWMHLGGHEQLIVFWRSCFAAAFYVVVIVAARRTADFKPRGQSPMLIASGLVTAGFAICVYKAYNLVSVGTATFLLYLSPVLVAVMAPLVLKEKLERSTLICLGVALAGTGMLSWGQSGTSGRSSGLGILYALASAVAWAVLMIIWKRLRETTSPLTIGIWTNVVVAAVSAGFAVPSTYLITTRAWIAIAIFGTVSFGVASLTYFYALKRVKVQDAAILSYVEPVSAMVLGFALLSEVPQWPEYLGAALIVVAGVLLLRLRAASRERKPVLAEVEAWEAPEL
jgi:drug/metabolite transporter (DMT)-like permease